MRGGLSRPQARMAASPKQEDSSEPHQYAGHSDAWRGPANRSALNECYYGLARTVVRADGSALYLLPRGSARAMRAFAGNLSGTPPRASRCGICYAHARPCARSAAGAGSAASLRVLITFWKRGGRNGPADPQLSGIILLIPAGGPGNQMQQRARRALPGGCWTLIQPARRSRRDVRTGAGRSSVSSRSLGG